MTRALIADDERLMREQLRTRLSEVWPELELVGEAKNGGGEEESCRASSGAVHGCRGGWGGRQDGSRAGGRA